LKLRKYTASLLIFALGFSISSPYFLSLQSFGFQNELSVSQKEESNSFCKFIWQLEDSQEVEEDSEDGDITLKDLSNLSDLFSNALQSLHFQHSRSSQLRLLLNNGKFDFVFSRLYIIFENLRN
jgi:hypothetical protein